MTAREYSQLLQLLDDDRFCGVYVGRKQLAGDDLAVIVQVPTGERYLFNTPNDFCRWYRHQRRRRWIFRRVCDYPMGGRTAL